MKIGLNATCFNARPSGANQRFIGIYVELVKQNPDDQFIIYEPADYHIGVWFNTFSNVTIIKTPIPSEGRINKILKGFWYWRKVLKDEKFDIFENFHLPLVRVKTGKTLFTLHDVRRLHSGGSSIFDRMLFRMVLGYTLKKIDHLLTVSESMKNEILSFYPDVSISVIYNGVDSDAYHNVSTIDIERFRTKYKIAENFLLSVGHFEKRKNYVTLVNAIDYLHKQGKQYNLLIIGNDSGESRVVRELIDHLNLSSSILILSGLSDQEVRCAYRMCSLFVFPSLYEGFGIPILEAMASESPITLSDIPVFREITENKGIYFSQNSSLSIAKTIDTTISSSIEQSRLIDYGKKRIKAFKFKKIARDLANVYREI